MRTSFERKILKSITLNDKDVDITRKSKDLAIVYIKKAFEAGMKRGYDGASNHPDMDQWLEEQKLV